MLEGSSFAVGMSVGFVSGALLAVALCFPRVARALGKFAAFVLIGGGAGLVTWGLISALNPGNFEELRMGAITFYTPAQTLGWGAGLLGSGITALVLSFVGRNN